MKRSTQAGLACSAVAVAALAWVVGTSAARAAELDLPLSYVLKTWVVRPTCVEQAEVSLASMKSRVEEFEPGYWKDPGVAEAMRRRLIDACHRYGTGR